MEPAKTQNKSFVEIDERTLRNLEKIAKESNFSSVEDLLTSFAESFSTGCSVTLTIGALLAKKAVA